MPIKFGDVIISDLSKKHINDCLTNNKVTMGPKTKMLEDRWSAIFGHNYTIAMSSGTAACTAMCMALLEMGAEPGDEVIVPALSFIASANAIRAANLKPVFIDVDVSTLNINPSLIEQAITKRTCAILAVNLMGKPFDVPLLRKIATENNLLLLGDCCESHGCSYRRRYMEYYCDATAYSCYAAHILFSCEMGFVCTNSDKIAKLVQAIRNHGRDANTLYFDHKVFGVNFKPTDLHASIGLGNIDSFWDIFHTRCKNRDAIKNGLSGIKDYCWFSEENPDYCNSPHAFSIVLKEPNAEMFQGLKKVLEENEIEWKRNFGSMPTQHRAFKYLGYRLGDFPHAEHCGTYGLHIGVHQYLTQSDIDKVISCINKFFGK